MDRATFDKMCNELFEDIREISARKGNDYSGNEDALKSFKRNAEATGLTPVQVWSVLTVKHWDAVMTYVKTGKVESEGLDNRIKDIILYMLLFRGLILEGGNHIPHPGSETGEYTREQSVAAGLIGGVKP